jgi:hypothetical protein
MMFPPDWRPWILQAATRSSRELLDLPPLSQSGVPTSCDYQRFKSVEIVSTAHGRNHDTRFAVIDAFTSVAVRSILQWSNRPGLELSEENIKKLRRTLNRQLY